MAEHSRPLRLQSQPDLLRALRAQGEALLLSPAFKCSPRKEKLRVAELPCLISVYLLSVLSTEGRVTHTPATMQGKEDLSKCILRCFNMHVSKKLVTDASCSGF